MTYVQVFKNMAYLMAHCMAQPGLGRVFKDLTTHGNQGGSEFYIKKDLEGRLLGQSFGRARQMYDCATLCGVIDGETSRLNLNPSDDLVIKPMDRLVLLACDHTKLNPLWVPHHVSVIITVRRPPARTCSVPLLLHLPSLVLASDPFLASLRFFR